MKQIIYLVLTPQIDKEKVLYGETDPTVLYASTSEEERDEFYKNFKLDDSITFCEERILDLDNIARHIWNKLNPIEKLSLERVNCCLWDEPPISKYSV